MKQFKLVAAFATALAAMATGCSSTPTDGSGELGSVGVNLLIGNTDVTAVSFEVVCDSGITLSGQFNVNDDQTPPVWAAIMDLPPGDCTITMVAFDNAGAPLCTGSQDFTVVVNQTVKVDVVLVCNVDGVDPLGNIDVDATFEIVVGNNCPRLHFLNAVPNNVPAEGSEVTVLVSDAEGDPLTTALTATGGSFADPSAQLTTYTCNGASGGQTISVTVSDGDPACDKSKSFDVTCPGVNPCDGVVCDDTGNPCTVEECNPANGLCEESNVPNGTTCTTGGGGELTINGDFETGDTSGWEFFPNDGSFAASNAEANGGIFSGNLIASVPGGGGPPSFPVIKQANLGVGVAQPNSTCDVSFDLKGTLAGAGGVFFAEFFSELSGGGTSSTEILSGGPLFPTGTWTTYSFTPATGNDVSGGVTLQLKADCGANPGCTVNAFIDNVSVNCGGNGTGGAGTCQEGVCEPTDLCSGVDCNDNNECTTDACNPADGQCSNTPNTGASCDGGAGTCDAAGVCQPNDLCAGVDCNDNNECTIDACDPADGTCSNTPDTGASCDGGAGTCDAAGVCQANKLYNQDFEGLDPADANALSGNGWLYFGNVYDGAGNFKFGFGPFGAPTTTGQISAIATGEGGPDQGTNQLVVFSNYDCCGPGTTNEGHFNGTDLVETIVFQEINPIPADLINQVLTFMFDAKRGNIGGNTTAQAFIRTLDPSAGFATTNNIVVDTTNLPVDWTTLSLSIDLSDPALEGQILQFGFSTIASNFDPAGNFYDNVMFGP